MTVGAFKGLPEKSFPRSLATVSEGERFWRKYKTRVVAKESGPISGSDVADRSENQDFAICSSFKVDVFCGKALSVKRSLTRFKSQVTSTALRGDGRIAAAGDSSGLVQLFDVENRTVLREMHGHDKAVGGLRFFSSLPGFLCSGASDATVRLWDITSGSPVSSWAGHSDYVRSLDCSHPSGHTVISGSYDGTVRIWDSRSGTTTEQFYCGSPVESVLLLPQETLLATSCGPLIKIWDLVGGRLLMQIENHQKTVTSLALDRCNAALLAGSLDRTVKAFDLQTFRTLHAFRYPAPIISLAVSGKAAYVAAGASNGTLSVRAIREAEAEISLSETNSFGAGTPREVPERFRPRNKPNPEDILVKAQRRKRSSNCDSLLRTFQYRKALDLVLHEKRPEMVATLLEELIRRNALMQTLSDRDDAALEGILRFLVSNIRDPKYGNVLFEVGEAIVSLYFRSVGQSAIVDNLLCQLQQRIKSEIEFNCQLKGVVGSIDSILCCLQK